MFKTTDNDEEMLVGQVPIEISSLFYHFLKDQNNIIKLRVIEKRIREVGLVVPASFEAYTETKQTPKYLMSSWQRGKNSLRH